MVAFTTTETLSLVMTSWRSPVRGVSRMSTVSIRSTNGSRKVTPGFLTEWNWPSRFTTPTSPCWITRMVRETMTIASTTIRAATNRATYEDDDIWLLSLALERHPQRWLTAPGAGSTTSVARRI